MMAFTQAELASIASAREVRIETQAGDGHTYRTVIWIVVDDGVVYIRSVRGDTGRWYQRTIANPSVKIIVGQLELHALGRPVADEPSIQRVSDALQRKYGTGASVDAMLDPVALHTTLRLEAAG